MLSENFVYLAFALIIVGDLSYAWAVLKARVRPNRVTWSLWVITASLGFLGQLDEDVGVQALLTLGAGIGPALILLASFLNPKSYWQLRNIDYGFGGLALIGIVLWQITGEGNLAVAFALLVELMAAMPTVIKAYKQPKSESPIVFGLCTVASIITVMTIDDWSFAEYSLPIYFALICATLFALVQFKLGPKIMKANSHD